ncbi:MAG: hypothetical protein A2X67_09535 [Ignavibacteria bacterium GWA2_55_11]|nr:MAG: hypothetical protein A2X67_09535 [Ignavibacteria bacterium GWA2_55_11]OGU43285.1 MAG: hypothetical protein A2X68_08970 [Ignavibacteria bacterium GWC2_56_12]OGU66802.1 MAG: hypothetical protein A3C56_00410 [Ignavibacteria bacterium RIFCSPHIGHO2_02_FULL_56_12]OGU71421.1 MAG: hypothetical protein A3G43_13010 [Ignavibacteria bacterium RIFCSPLOWO2_12_FULL_56_21]OGU74423.1 MAG: hypothetical protein A3H45_11125 [Ignavibacteria bacterium RIFCSPLOWO2_02_FULL_55_14]
MEDRLRLLYSLQKIDSSLDELRDLKGDLPKIVADLVQKVKERIGEKHALEETVKAALVRRDATDTEILSLREKAEKYKTQQFEVKTNRQYDMLAREIDAAQEAVARMTKELELLEGRATVARDDAARLVPEIETLEGELADQRNQLEAVNKEHEEEELKLKHEREKIVVRIKPADLTMYERIRKAKDGRAVVAVKRRACGGCYNRVPPQKVLELRKNDMFMTCERCGRILVSDEITEAASPI